MFNIDRYDNYFNDGDYFVYTASRNNYIIKIINVNIGSVDMDIVTVPNTPIFYNAEFTKFSADIPQVYKVIELYK